MMRILIILIGLNIAACEAPERETDRLAGTDTVKGKTNVYTGGDRSRDGQDETARAGDAPFTMHTLGQLEREFVNDVVKESVGGLIISGLASEKAEAPAVRTLAESLEKHHANSLDSVREIAQKPIRDREMEPDERKLYEQLSALKGSEFEQAYLGAVIERHERRLKLFRHVATASHDEVLKDFIAAAIPEIEDNLRTAKALRPH